MATKKAPSVKKTAPKSTVASTESVKAVKAADKKSAELSVAVMGTDGKSSGTVTLASELFGVKVNASLLAQSVRVFLANQREGGARSKTRGMVEGSSRKIYRQKGTGKARHGSIRAPIFVGGGVVFGPVPRDYHLTMTKQMRRGALVSALSLRKDDVIVVDGLEKMGAKTKAVAGVLEAIGANDKVLLVVAQDSNNLIRAARNIEYVDIIGAKDLNPYEVITHKKLVFTKASMEESKSHFTK